MSFTKTNSPKQFPKEWEFKMSVKNAETYLESCASGQPYKPIHPEVTAPFPINRLVDELIAKYSAKNKILDLYGTLYVKMRNEWYDYYEPKDVGQEDQGQRLPQLPPQRPQ